MTLKTSRLKATWRSGKAALGGWCSIPSSFTAEIVASLGFDYVCVDLQHGLADFGDLVPMLQAISIHGPTPLVRVPWGDLGTAQRALDAGAEGLIFPMISTRDEAASAVAASRYPPAGKRSYGPIRARMHIGPDAAHANAEIACVVMVETEEALENLEGIVSCPGVDGIYVGPNDLALALGLEVGSEDPKLNDALDRVLKMCDAYGVSAGIHAFSAPAARSAVERGFTMVTVSGDAAMLTAAYRTELREAAEPEPQHWRRV